MRIAFLTFEFPDARPGGIGSYVLKCAKALAAIGHEPHIFTLSVPQAVLQRLPASVRVHEVLDTAQRVEAGKLSPALGAAALGGSQSTYKLLVGALLCDALRSEHQANPFDIVEAAEWEALALPLLVHPIANLPVVIQIHLGSAANWFGNCLAPDERDDLAEALELASIVGADAVCAATQSIVNVTRSLCPFEREVTIIPYPVEIEAGDTVSAPSKDGSVLFVGRLQRRKGCDVFAAAADIFLRRNPLATIRIAGSDTNHGGSGHSMLAEMKQSLDPSLHARFVYLGELSQTHLRREIDACRFQVVPSIVDNFANTAIDAMARGRLVVYGGETGLDEVVGDAGIRVFPLTAESLAEKMDLAWNDPAVAQDHALRALDRLRTKFDPAAVSKQRVRFYEQVISTHQTVPAGNRQWQALGGSQIRAVLNAMIWLMSSAVGLRQETPTPGGVLRDQLQSLAAKLKRPPNVWLFGAGRFTQRLLAERHLWESRGLKITGLIDEHPQFQQSPTHLGLPIGSPAHLLEAIKSGLRVDAIVLSTDTLKEVFRQRAQCFTDLGIEILSL